MIRTKSILTDRPNLEHLYTFYDFPVYVGCVPNRVSYDIFSDMTFDICKDTGIIQLRQPLPLSTVYMYQHNDGIGQTWNDHYEAFCQFLHKSNPGKVLEIGAANGQIAQIYTSRHKIDWIIVEPHPIFQGNDQIKIQKEWFNAQTKIDPSVDTIIHTHVIEHMYEPTQFLQNIYNALQTGQIHVFSIPNMLKQLANKYTNCLNFEHTIFLTEPIVDYLLSISGFDIVDKEYFGEHSIFYSVVKTQPQYSSIQCYYHYYKKLFNEFVQYHIRLIDQLNAQLANFNSAYLFGAHIFSQFLLNMGLRKDKIVGILDNSTIKQGQRLYGTNLMVDPPTILQDKDTPVVILKAAGYRNEIYNQIQQLNPSTVILE